MTFKGRHWIMVWLLVFLVVALAVQARQSAALRTARTVGDLRRQRVTLESRRSDLERRIREASSRGVLGPRAERLGLRFPSDTDYTMFSYPPTGEAGR